MNEEILIILLNASWFFTCDCFVTKLNKNFTEFDQ
jgi:hypothetical protein